MKVMALIAILVVAFYVGMFILGLALARYERRKR